MVGQAAEKVVGKILVMAIIIGAGGMALILAIGYLIAWSIGLI